MAANAVAQTPIDPRLRQAVDASVGWYDDLCAVHGVGSALSDGLWMSLGPPPPLHSDAVAVEPSVTVDQVLAALGGRAHAGIKDSFATIDLAPAGWQLLFAATWIHRDEGGSPRTDSSAWRPVTDAAELGRWTAHHDTAEVLLPALLNRAHFKILGRHAHGELTAGAVARLGSGVVDVSNLWAAPNHLVDWDELADAVHAAFPGRPLVGYERGDDLERALAGRFTAVGPLRVWVR